MSVETGDIVSRIYNGFRGVDFRGEEINLVRSPDSLNVWRDYKHTDSIRTRPGMKLLNSFDAPIYGIFFYRASGTDMMLVHSGTKLYKVVNGVKTELYSGLKAAQSDSFIYNSVWYFKDGAHYLKYDGKTVKAVEEEAYIPTTSIGRRVYADDTLGSDILVKTTHGGAIHEDVNLLQTKRKNEFVLEDVASGSYGSPLEIYLELDAQNIDEDFTPVVLHKEKKVTPTSIDYEKGQIRLTMTQASVTEGDTFAVEFKKAVKGYTDRIHKCTLLQVFDNRVFFSGNPDYPNVVYHCSLNDPAYVSDLDYYNEGLDSAAVKGLVAGNNALWVFREPSQANTSVFYHTPTIDSEYGKIYPSQHSSITLGCVGKAINFNDDIIFFSERGMEGISGDITTEQAVAHRSALVDRKLLALADYKKMVLEEWEGYLIVFIGNKAFLADSRAVYTNENHVEYEFFYWEMSKDIVSARVDGGILYLGTADGVYTLTDNDCAIESYWVTPKDKFGVPHKLKTTNKRGCIVEATGDISVYAKIEDTDFELIGEYKNITDYFTSRIKRKKFKDIQLKFHSNTRFSLETATLEVFIGGYIKR